MLKETLLVGYFRISGADQFLQQFFQFHVSIQIFDMCHGIRFDNLLFHKVRINEHPRCSIETLRIIEPSKIEWIIIADNPPAAISSNQTPRACVFDFFFLQHVQIAQLVFCVTEIFLPRSPEYKTQRFVFPHPVSTAVNVEKVFFFRYHALRNMNPVIVIRDALRR